MTVLVVEDDQKAARLLAKGLGEEGFVVDVAHSGEEGDEMASSTNYDAIVLDWLMPGKDGLQVCRDLRARGVSTPILMVTARDALADRVAGLNTGADDYLTKPFAFPELLARLRALLRRSELARPVVLRVGDLTLDSVSHHVARAGVRITLTVKEYAILEMLMRHTGEAVSRSELGEHIWSGEEDVTNLVDVHISHLRKKIDAGSAAPLIHTVRGRGYRVGRDVS